jgi:proton-translocating NAD(P)+ transhydrogenase subunit beta
VSIDARALLYLVAAIAFILGLKRLGSPRTARSGNTIAATGMLMAIIVTLIDADVSWGILGSGLAVGALLGGIAAVRVQMTSMPQLVAAFNGFGGIASALVAGAEFVKADGLELPTETILAIILSVLIGAITFTGSFVAYAKLQGLIGGSPIIYPGQKAVNGLLATGIVAAAVVAQMNQDALAFWMIGAAALVLGVLAVIPIGGADMPVVIALLNSYSGLAASATGFVLSNNALIISGALVGASGLILTSIMCRAMNRSLANVLFSAFGVGMEARVAREEGEQVAISIDGEDAAMMLGYASQVIFVPGYGLAVAQAQHKVRELADLLMARGVRVKFVVHPVAGRMPGHMNVLLAEANVPYDQLYEPEDVNPDMENVDVAVTVGANDVVNPLARDDATSPIAGMPIIDVDKANTVVVIKRSLSPGFAGIPNPLFSMDNTLMFFSDGRKAIQDIIAAVKEAA